MALHSRGSIMSLNELSEEELDSRIKAGFQRVMQNLARCTASTLYDLQGCARKVSKATT